MASLVIAQCPSVLGGGESMAVVRGCGHIYFSHSKTSDRRHFLVVVQGGELLFRNTAGVSHPASLPPGVFVIRFSE